MPMKRQESRPSIGIRRRSSAHPTRPSAALAPSPAIPQEPDTISAVDFAPRRRSSSEPRPVIRTDVADDALVRSNTRSEGVAHGRMPTLSEEHGSASPRNDATMSFPALPIVVHPDGDSADPSATGPATQGHGLGSRALNGLGRTYLQNRRRAGAESDASQPEYNSDLVNLLDVVDPEVSTLSTLTNVQNSLFIPDLGSWVNRRPTYNLSAMPPRLARQNTAADDEKIRDAVDDAEKLAQEADLQRLTSQLSQSRYAVLPHGVQLEGWTEEEKEQLNDHVRHMLHSRRAAFKRGWKGFKQYVRRPLGFFVTLYAFLITVFGFTWVLFLIGWVSLGSRRDYVINVIDNVLVALFAVVGDGLIPWRTVDTYHMIFIAHYHHLTWRLRKEKRLPKLPNQNDLPTRISLDINRVIETPDLEAARTHVSSDAGDDEYVSVLTPEQQRKLEHHQTKFAKSHTFYKPHETETHYAFPLRLLVAIVVLLDFHSIFQIALGVTTLTCNITGGILISIGDKRTRKKEVRERMFRQELTDQAIKKVEKRRKKKEGIEGSQESSSDGLEGSEGSEVDKQPSM
ncbi:sodium/hydrogen antiporter [Sphaceloma murrayae]|uniref:Sodium/hydrogen antiporter n=1 Tax=Sphaceloma murrayae TaxID=2082308 RepID=A0A2K1R3C2_9PEZI|nr:sodium/hydrogen antiporter [Sphaceloma murrayae]